MSDRTELLKLHDWDELLFGGFYCLHCTPDDEDSFDDPIAWPCPPLREAGVTDDEAREMIAAYREKVAAEYQAQKEAQQAEAQRQVDAFNSAHPVGTPVFAYPGFRPEDAPDARRLVTRTRTAAQLSASSDPVVWVEGEGSYICLTHVDPVSESVWRAAKEAEETAAAVAAMGALPVPVGDQPQPLDDQRLAEIAERTPKRAAALTAWLNQNSPVDGQRALENAETVLAEDVPALLAEVQRLKAERHSTNEVLSDTAEALREMRDRLAEYERPADAYPPALPWAQLMDDEDLSDFLDELAASAVTHGTSEVCLTAVEDTIARWRLIGEAQHAHNTAPGPDAEELRSCCAGPVCTCTPSSPQDDEYIPPREDRPGMRHAVRTTIPASKEA